MAWPTFKTKDEVPEGFRDEYEEKGGEWRPKDVAPTDDGSKELKDSVARLEASLAKERDERKAAEKKAKKVADELKDLEHKKKAEGAGITEERLKELRQEIRDDLDKEYRDDLEERNTLKIEVRELKLDGKVKALAAQNGVRAERISQWWRQFSDRFELTDDGAPMVKDRLGTEVGKFIAEELKKELPDFYEGTKAAGGGSGGDQTGGKVAGGDLSSEDIIANPVAALTAAREAEQG